MQGINEIKADFKVSLYLLCGSVLFGIIDVLALEALTLYDSLIWAVIICLVVVLCVFFCGCCGIVGLILLYGSISDWLHWKNYAPKDE